MLSLPAPLSDRRTIRLLDVLVVVWLVAWIGVGYWVYHAVEGLGSLSHTVVLAGQAVNSAASALDTIGRIPLVGAQVGGLVQSAHQAANSAVYNGAASKGDIDTLAELLWATIALAPTTPLLILYALLRRGWQRDVQSLREVAGSFEDDAAFQRFLARRALEHFPYRRLRRISPNPWRDYEEGRTEALARAELRRIGLQRNGR